MFESSSIHCVWDKPQHFLKTHFSLESGFLLFLELQKSLLVSRVIKNRCLEYCYPSKLGRWTLFGQWTPHTTSKMTCIPLHKTLQMNLPWLMKPQYQSRDDLHTTTQNLADEPTLPEYNGKVWKLSHSPFLRYPTAFSQNTFLLRKWLSFVPRAPEIPTSNFSGVLNTMAKVW